MTRATTQPVFVDRKTAAEMLMISVDTFDTWLRAGFIPGPQVSRGQIIRWHWPTLEQHLAETKPTAQHDPFVMRVRNATKGRRRDAA